MILLSQVSDKLSLSHPGYDYGNNTKSPMTCGKAIAATGMIRGSVKWPSDRTSREPANRGACRSASA